MTVPPLLVRRLVLAPLILLAELAVVALSPLLFVLAAALSLLTGGRRPVRLLAIAVSYAREHVAASASRWTWGRGCVTPPPARSVAFT